MSEIFVGKTTDGFKLCLKQKTRLEHTQIIAATGRGKTMSVIQPWMTQDFCRGSNVILIDGKGDRDLSVGLKRFANHPDDVVVFDIGDLESSAVTNPIASGSPQQVCDRIFSTFEFENIYFENAAYESALMVLEILRAKGITPTFREIYLMLNDDSRLTNLVTTLSLKGSETLKSLALIHLAKPFKDRQEKLSGFLSQLRPFAVGELSDLVNGNIEGRVSFSLSELVRRKTKGNKAIMILIPALLYQKSASRLGQMFLQEIAWASACRESTEFLPVFLDEFSSFVYEGFIQFLNKARSSGLALHLSHQSMGDLESVSPEFAKAVVTNTNVKCVLGVNEPETAEFFANLFGTKETTKQTERGSKKFFGDVEMSGEMSVRQVEEFRIHPNKFKRFRKGEGVIGFMTSRGPLIEEMDFFPIPGAFA